MAMAFSGGRPVAGSGAISVTTTAVNTTVMGPVGSEIIITIVREGEAEPFDVSLIRDTIKLTAVRSRTEGNAEASCFIDALMGR